MPRSLIMKKYLSGKIDGIKYDFKIEDDGYWDVKINDDNQSILAQSLSGDLTEVDKLRTIIDKINSPEGWAGEIASYSKSQGFIFVEPLVFGGQEEKYTDAQANKILGEWYDFVTSTNAYKRLIS